ncbi:ChaN family lipoprotein [Oceaniglobus roseus]|uniref:ChaN family lipoprotein n=1 Tax=Oceaniglobus roseus TaxID=1737570 RepID=UPI000C7F6DA5|nr:ChaN family lipoprotein [Kandeliimicrobium roseum]
MRIAPVLILLACLPAPGAFAQPAADITLLGEVHDNPDAHLAQAAAIEALRPTAVVFEMLTAEEAEAANADRARLPEIWAASGWPDFALYAPVFDALGEAVIVGAAAPRDTVRAVYDEGAAALFGADAPRFGLDRALPAEQQAAREALQFEAHCGAMPVAAMAGMVAIQRYRDAVFARAALEALETYGAPIAVIAGNGHARTDWGVPAAIAQAAPDVTTHAIGFVEGADDTPFDEVRIVPPAARPDLCASLRSQ